MSEREWNDAYDSAMQSRDWQTCEMLLDERERADWYLAPKPKRLRRFGLRLWLRLGKRWIGIP